MSEKINKNFKGLYDTSKTTFITDRTEPTHFYEPEVKTPKIKNVSYFINFDKKELYKQIEDLQKRVEQLESIRKEAIEYINHATIGADSSPIEDSWLYNLYETRHILNKGE